MNFLAHSLATYPHAKITLGNLAGDMIRNAELVALDAEIRAGVEVHRAIDAFTDQHPEIRALVLALRPVHGKYAPVAVDVILDYILTTDWHHHSDLEFGAFTLWVYDTIDQHAHLLPERVANRLQGMRRHHWLEGYRTRTGLLSVLRRMDTRARFPSRFAEGLKDLDGHYGELRDRLRSFYPDLIEHAARTIQTFQKK